jgi:hypothetical protein
MADETDPKPFEKALKKENKRHEQAVAKLFKKHFSKRKKGR